MSGIRLLRWLSGLLCLSFTAFAILTSLRESIFHIPKPVQADPWFQLTLVDAVISLVLLSALVVYKEPTWRQRLPWIVAFLTLGSSATTGYLWLQTLGVPNNAPLAALLAPKGSQA